MEIFFSVGEPSGDLHGANLIRAMREKNPSCKFVGYGGPRMAAAGCDLHSDLTQLAVMWIAQVLLNFHKFLSLVRQANRYFRQHQPDAVVLIDYPGFNWWIARRAKAHGIPVFYYGAPQLWAWAPWRIHKMRKFVDHVLCKLPFEEKWYGSRGCNATYVGHPYFDQLQGQKLDDSFIEEMKSPAGPLVAILPGSRTQEVKSNLHWLLKAAEKVHDQVPSARFAIASFKEKQAEYAEQLIEKTSLPITVQLHRTGELISASDCTMAVSGSVSLELLYHTTPSVVLYWVTKTAFFAQKFFRRVRYITLVNLLTTEDLFPRKIATYDRNAPEDSHVLIPEYLTCEDKTTELASHVIEWLTNSEAKASRVAELVALKEKIGAGGASARAADYILESLEQQRQPLRTHVSAA